MCGRFPVGDAHCCSPHLNAYRYSHLNANGYPHPNVRPNARPGYGGDGSR
jgi:hypothetical protein